MPNAKPKHTVHLDVTEDEAWQLINPQMMGEESRDVRITAETAKQLLCARVDTGSFNESVHVTFRFLGDEIARARVDRLIPPGHEDGHGKYFTICFSCDTHTILPADDTSHEISRQRPDDHLGSGSIEFKLAEYWIKENDPSRARGTNYGCGTLQDIFLGVHKHHAPPADWRVMLTNRERRLFATFVQWLGTNCGRGFLFEAFRSAGVRVDFNFQDRPRS